jgi:hypothetical protein
MVPIIRTVVLMAFTFSSLSSTAPAVPASAPSQSTSSIVILDPVSASNLTQEELSLFDKRAAVPSSSPSAPTDYHIKSGFRIQLSF